MMGSKIPKRRLIESIVVLLKEAAEMSSLKQAFALITRLVGKSFGEEQVAVRYDPNTGEPVEYVWKTTEYIWNGKLWLGGGDFPYLSSTSPLFESIQAQFQPGEVMVLNVGSETFVVDYIPAYDDGDWKSGGTIPAHLYFKKAVL